MKINEIMEWRYATKRMTQQRVSNTDLETIVEAMRLSPSAYGLQPYSILITENCELKNKIYEKSSPQKVILECSHLVIFKTMKNLPTEYIEDYLAKLKLIKNESDEFVNIYRQKVNAALNSGMDIFEWAKSQTYIALSVGMLAAASLKIDSTPIEGFDPKELNKILNLDTEKEETTLMLTLGYRDTQNDQLAQKQKIRREKKDFLEIV